MTGLRRIRCACTAGECGLLTSLDNEKVLGVNVAVLGKVEVLLGNENALCGDRVSAYPYMQQSREFIQVCHSHGSGARWNTNLGRGTWRVIVSRVHSKGDIEGSNEAQAQGWIFRANVHISIAPQ
jgi:hypothetical protein